MKNPDRLIIIDDDEQSNIICRYIVRHALGEDTEVLTFTGAVTGIEFIKSDQLNRDNPVQKIILLDINMPQISGWEALDMLSELDELIKKQLRIYMFSSSIDPKDKKRAMEHPIVEGFIEKPLSVARVLDIFKAVDESRTEFCSK